VFCESCIVLLASATSTAVNYRIEVAQELSPSHPNMALDCEVLVVGAGPVGLLTTLLVAKAGVNVILVDALPDIDDSPRAMAYGPPAVVELERAGIAADAREVGMDPDAYDHRLRWITIDNKLIAQFQHEDKIPDSFDPVLCGQFQLAKIIQRHLERYPCAKVSNQDWSSSKLSRLAYLTSEISTDDVQILFSHKVTDIKQDEDSITATLETEEGNKQLTAKYLAGTDGGKSSVRKILDLGYEGFTLPQWLVACNVRYPFQEYGFARGQFIVHPEHFCMVGRINPQGLFRVSYNEKENMSREEVLANVHNKFEAIFPGPKPLSKDAYHIEMVSPYRIHQRTANSYRKGRAFLAGDAAHACSPFGGEYTYASIWSGIKG
jgi:2-polyprenyl-6-methoxyphenol hydroxylase-like FAD-dependent oxidoreductase